MIPSLTIMQSYGSVIARTSETVSESFGTRPSYVPGDLFQFSQVARTLSFPVKNGKIFRITLVGAAGGSIGNPGSSGGNSNGGTLDVDINLTIYNNSSLIFNAGGGGQNSTANIDGSMSNIYAGGFNGGGMGEGTRGPGGGGRTDLRVTSNSLTELLVAGGGGGGSGNMGSNGVRVNGTTPTPRMYGNYAGDNGGGGGGYYGGQSSGCDDCSDAGSGTNYSSPLVTNTYQDTRIVGRIGGNQGSGYFVVRVVSIN